MKRTITKVAIAISTLVIGVSVSAEPEGPYFAGSETLGEWEINIEKTEVGEMNGTISIFMSDAGDIEYDVKLKIPKLPMSHKESGVCSFESVEDNPSQLIKTCQKYKKRKKEKSPSSRKRRQLLLLTKTTGTKTQKKMAVSLIKEFKTKNKLRKLVTILYPNMMPLKPSGLAHRRSRLRHKKKIN